MKIRRVHASDDHIQRKKEILINFDFNDNGNFYESAHVYCNDLKLLDKPNDETKLASKNYSEAFGTGTGLMIVAITRRQASDFGSALKKLTSDNEQLKDD